MYLRLLEEEIERYANAVEADKVGEFVSATKTYPIFVMTYNGEEICLAQAQLDQLQLLFLIG